MSNIFKKNQINKFNEAKPAGAGALAPRPGHYFIIDVKFREIGTVGMVPIAQVNWKSNKQGVFYSDCVHEIAISGFYNENGQRISDTEIFALIGKTVNIYDVQVVHVIDTKTKPTLKYKWVVLETEFAFKTTSQAGLESFFGSSTNINEAYQNFVDNAPYDVATAEDVEAIGEIIVYDEPDFSADYDGLDDSSDNNDDSEPNDEGAVLA